MTKPNELEKAKAHNELCRMLDQCNQIRRQGGDSINPYLLELDKFWQRWGGHLIIPESELDELEELNKEEDQEHEKPALELIKP